MDLVKQFDRMRWRTYFGRIGPIDSDGLLQLLGHKIRVDM
jgi:hypothetical protein